MFIYTLCLYTRAHTHEYAYLSIHSNAIILSSTTHFHILRSCPARVIYYYVVCTHINNTLQRLREILRQSSVNVYSGSCATFVAATRLTDRPTDRPSAAIRVYMNVTTWHHNLYTEGGSPPPFHPTTGFSRDNTRRKSVEIAVPH